MELTMRRFLAVFFASVMAAWLLGLAVAHAQAQDRWAAVASPVFRTYNLDDGLPNLMATALAEDREGFIWVGTEGGLARWDGYNFRTYKPAADGAGALPDSWVTTMHIDPDGRLWIGTSAGGLALYDRYHDRFITYGGGPGGLGNVNVRAIADDGTGGLWIGTDGGLDHFDPGTSHVKVLRHDPRHPSSLPDDHIFALLRDHAGALWAGTAGGLARLLPAGNSFSPLALNGTSSAAVGVSSLCEDTAGRLWIGTLHDGAFTLQPDRAGAAVRVAANATWKGGSALAGQRVRTIAQVAPDKIWFGTYGHGIVALDTQTGQTTTIGHDPLVRQSLPDDIVWALHMDRAGGMWVASGAGVSRLNSAASGSALTVFGDPSGPHGLTESNFVVSLAAASDGRVWAGMLSKGVDIFDPLRGRVMNLAPDAGKPDQALPANMVNSFAEWPNNTMFVATQHGLYRADLNGHGVSRVAVPGRDVLSSVHWLLAAAGRLWIAGNDDGVWSIVPDGGVGSPVEHFDADRLTDRRATVFTLGSPGDLWIGTRNGLNRLDLATRIIEQILPDRSNPAALGSGLITWLLVDRSGRLWVGTYGGGIAVLVAREHGRPVFRRISVAQGLPDDNVDSMLADSTGRIWAATDNGIAVIDPKDFSVHALHRAEGVEISAYWASSAAATASGELLFGGVGGLTVIRPDRFRVWDYRPPVVVTDVRVGGKPVLAERFNGKRIGIAQPLQVYPDANSLTVEFSSLDYSSPERNHYAYQLEGFDRGWVETGPGRRLASYTNLPPGSYTLRLRGSNRNGVWTDTVLDIPVRVLAAWFQTVMFKIILACLALASVTVLVQARTQYLRRRQRELEHLVTERTVELTKRTSELEESKRQIEEIAYHDALTGLPNRRLFNEKLRDATDLFTRDGSRFFILMIDLDRFKHINDTFGHDAGDALLIEAADRMRACLRACDRLVRLGGDEFAILITDISDETTDPRAGVDTVSRRIIECFVQPVLFQGAEMKTSASIGVAMCPFSGTTPKDICKGADLALYEAKRAGRNTSRWHSSSSDVHSTPVVR